jgi:hypothetical protein
MKRKAMLMGAALIAGVPAGALAKSEVGGGERTIPRLTWESAYSPHYGPLGAARPWMEHLEATGAIRYFGGIVESVRTHLASPAGSPGAGWRLDFSMPRIVLPSSSEPEDVRPGRRLGITVSFSF